MIINNSRGAVFKKCRRDCFNRFHRRKEGVRSTALLDGGAFHEGVAVGLATKDWQAAIKAADVKFNAEVAASTILPEELALAANHRGLVHAMLREFRKGYETEQYTVIQPECNFDVELPGSMHHCVFVHHRLWNEDKSFVQDAIREGTPDPEHVLAGRVIRCDCPVCLVPHRLVGKTDAIVAWNNLVWLLEHKTTAILGQQFWDGFQLDSQPRTYVYGIYKSLGFRPTGVLVNAIYKPTEKQVAGWGRGAKKIEDYIRYEREPFLFTQEDLEEVEEDYIDLCNEWEDRVVSGRWPKSNLKSICMSYNRRCDFYSACMAHDKEGSLEIGERPRDYVDIKVEELIKERSTR